MTAREEIATCAISGAVGTFAQVDPRVEAYVAEKMGLKVEPVSTQVIPRDRHAAYFCTLAVVASSVERLAVEIRHLQRTEVLEAEEPFDPGQKGSSAMPHKRNPILTENLTGLARLARFAAITGSRKRGPLARARHQPFVGRARHRARRHDSPRFRPSSLGGPDGAAGLYPENMANNLDRLGGLVNSQWVTLALTQKGVSARTAYAAAQTTPCRSGRREGHFLTLLAPTPTSRGRLSDAELEALFDMAHHTKHVDTIFARVLQD